MYILSRRLQCATSSAIKSTSNFNFFGAAAGTTILGGLGYYYFINNDASQSSLLTKFEEFNDWSREKFWDLGEMIVPTKPAPWLLDLETLKYPDYIPTLILDLDKVLCHMEHDRRIGWRVVKRPGADQFLRELQHYYEIVVFSDEVVPVASDVMNKWMVPTTGVLHRDFCRKNRDGTYRKDIRKLGREEDKMIFIDHDPRAFNDTTPRNGICIKPFDGDENDRELFDLIDFLKAAATSQEDVRKFIEKYDGGDENIGRRFLIEKKDREKKVENRRVFGRSLVNQNFQNSPFGGNRF